MADEREGFLGRWSRLKQERDSERPVEEPRAVPAVEPAVPATAESAEGEAGGDQGGDQGDGTPDLPPIESLDKDSDFAVFMKKGVPEETKRLALRALWRSDPVLTNLDGLLEYGEDFSAPWKTGGAVETVYRVGKGMPDLLERLVGTEKEEDVPKEAGDPAPQESLCDREERPLPDGADRSPQATGTAPTQGEDEGSSKS